MYRASTTIDDIYRLAFPADAKLIIGGEFLNHTVTWACSLRPSPPAFPKLDGSELALIDMEDLRRLDPKMRLERVVRTLAGARISAIAVSGTISQVAISAARASGIVLFQLPESTSLVQVERTVIRLIVDRDGYITQRSADLQRELNQIALDSGGLGRIAQHIQQFAQQPFIFLREDGQVVSGSILDTLPEHQKQAISQSLPNIMTLRSWTVSQSASQGEKADLSKSIGVLPLNPASEEIGYQHVVVCPVFANDLIRGYCLLLRSTGFSTQGTIGDEATVVEQIAVGQGAAAAALEWARQNAVDVAEDRMRAAFLDELLATEIADEQAWIQRGHSLGYDLTQPHVAWQIEANHLPNWPNLLLHFLEERGMDAPLSRRGEGILLFWPIENPKSGRELKVVADELVIHLLATAPQAEIVIGIGRPGVRPGLWLQSLQQARESWRLGKEWKGAPVTYFGDLGLYQLLTALGENMEAIRFFHKTLGRLIAHDKNHNAALVETLETFFACHGNLSQTASRLHIHRNTLTYRLDRISVITQLDLNDSDARFSLQLALKLRPIIKV